MSATVSLTFDNGPNPGVTEGVLEALRQRGLRASFFMIGRLAAAAPDLVARVAAEGHRIGNHTWSHSQPLGRIADPAQVREEVLAAHDLLAPWLGEERLFRPLGGRGAEGGQLGPHLLSPLAVDLLREREYTVVLWNALPRDWVDPAGWPETARRACEGDGHRVMVLHDLPTGAMDALPGFLDRALADGVRFVTDFPDDCVPMRRGRAQPSLARFTG